MHFYLFRFPVEIRNDFWLMTAVLGFAGLQQGDPLLIPMLLIWMAVVLLSILLHELGHTLTMRHFGANARIVLYGMGGLAIPDRNSGRWQGLVISLMGPVFGLLLGGLVWVLIRTFGVMDSRLAVYAVNALLYVNIYWSLMNLLPIPPLDGGHITQALLGPRRQRIASIIGIVGAVGICLWALKGREWWLLLLFGSLAYQNFQALQAIKNGPQRERRRGDDAHIIQRNDNDPDWWKR